MSAAYILKVKLNEKSPWTNTLYIINWNGPIRKLPTLFLKFIPLLNVYSKPNNLLRRLLETYKPLVHTKLATKQYTIVLKRISEWEFFKWMSERFFQARGSANSTTGNPSLVVSSSIESPLQ